MALALRLPTLIEAASPAAPRTVRLIEAAAMSLLMGLCAQWEVRLPFTPVPMTGQTAAVLFAGALLGSRWGPLSVALYLLQGALGLPVFAGGAAGAVQFLGPTGGYLIGFLPGAWAAGRLAERGWDRSPATAAAMMLISSLAIFLPGLLCLARFVPAGSLLAVGFFPFLPGDVAKAVLAAAALPLGWKLLRK